MKHEGEAGEVSRETSQAIAGKAREVLQVLVQHLVDEPVIDELLEPGLIRFELSGSSTGLLIGRGGRTLDALEYLVNRIALRDEVGVAASRIEIDAAKYRARRAEALEELARQSAATAIQTGRPVELSPMNPRERRLVHLALKDEPGITSESEGEGDSRRIIVRPTGPR